MATRKQDAKILVNGINLTPIFDRASVSIDRGLRAHFAETRKALKRLDRIRRAFDDAMKDLEAQDKLDNFQIQDLMSNYNQMENLAATVQKKVNDTLSCMISKI